jgi:alpha-L-rhamnosidase
MSNLIPTYLRTEYLTNPMAVDVQQPRLSWGLQASDPATRGLRQSAYRIIVTDDRDAVVWDSRRVASDETAHIRYAYAGKPLLAGEQYHWKVRVWDENNKPSEWSACATWTMGVWGTGWSHECADDAPRPPVAAEWIGLPLGKQWDETKSPAATMLRKSFAVQGPVRRAVLYASALGVYELQLNGRRVGDQVLAPEWTDYLQKAQYQGYDVTALVQSGENVLGAQIGAGWYAGRLGMAEGFAGVWPETGADRPIAHRTRRRPALYGCERWQLESRGQRTDPQR